MTDEEFDDDIEYDERPCPKCGQYEIRRRDCTSLLCDEGHVDEYETDPINYAPGEYLATCDECGGHGCHVWCSNCGWDMLEKRFINGKSETK